MLTMLVALPAMAAKLAVIDSGIDYRHADLRDVIWTNPGEVKRNEVDDDGNGFVDDFYGWNFAEQNNLVIDYKYLGTFTSNPYKFFEIQARMFLGTQTEEDMEWLAAARNDQEIMAELQKFGNFVHGTHVAGIAMKHAQNSQLISVKIIPTEVNPFANELKAKVAAAKANGNEELRLRLYQEGLKLLAKQQTKMLVQVADYVGDQGAKIANGSFGTGFPQAKMIIEMTFKLVVGREPEEGEVDTYAKFFIKTLVEAGKAMVQTAPNTLFVFAAGNDGMDNDKYGAFPTNIDAPNVVSVAATFGRDAIASFSNFGIKNVDLGAPGVIINSAVPGDEYLKVSGTSQAAPYIASVALTIAEANPNLAPVQIKKILLETVDLKSFLAEKVKTGGIVNRQRAGRAATLSNSMSVDEAIQTSIETISDVEGNNKMNKKVGNGIVLPMPSLFQL